MLTVSQRDTMQVQLMNATLMALVIILWFVDRSSAVQMAALAATTMLAVTLIPARLLGLAWLRRAEPYLLQIARQGKWLGIWTGLWFLFYTALSSLLYLGGFDVHRLLSRDMILLVVSDVLFVGLTIISNRWSYAHIKWWKQLNMLIWLVVPFAATHLYISTNFNDAGDMIAPLAILGLAALAGVSGALRHKRDYFAFHRIAILGIGAAISTLVVLFYPAIV